MKSQPSKSTKTPRARVVEVVNHLAPLVARSVAAVEANRLVSRAASPDAARAIIDSTSEIAPPSDGPGVIRGKENPSPKLSAPATGQKDAEGDNRLSEEGVPAVTTANGVVMQAGPSGYAQEKDRQQRAAPAESLISGPSREVLSVNPWLLDREQSKVQTVSSPGLLLRRQPERPSTQPPR